MNIIDSIDNKKIKELNKLRLKKYRDINDKFLIEGIHLVEEAYESGYLEEIYILQHSNINIDIKTTYITEKVMKHISLLNSPTDVIGVAKKIEEKEILSNKIMYLDSIQDPGNLGNIIRSSYAFNMSLIISKDSVDIYNDKVIRATQGMLFKSNLSIKDINYIKKLKELGYRIYGTDVKKGISIKEIETFQKSVIIIGNEGQGIKKDIKKICDEFIYIDMNKDCDSLNVSVAASIIMYELKDII